MNLNCGRPSCRMHFLLLALLCLGIGGFADAAVYSLEITAPRPGLNTQNRYYKAYPGLVYEVDIAAIGGRYPYTFALSAAPAGMTINADTGRITWQAPASSAQPYSVSASVRDSAGASASVSWNVTVTTSGFRFVDGVAGHRASEGGDGSIANPWKSLADFYITKYDSSYRNEFVYLRNGTYYTADAPIENGVRMAILPGNKPLVWLAFPGEKPVIDTTGSHIAITGAADNTYFDGLTIQNFNTHFGVNIESNASNVVFRKNDFSNMQLGWGGRGTNAAALMISNGGSSGKNWVFLNNTFRGIHDEGYGLLGYLTDRTLVQGNVFSGFTHVQSKPIGPKTGNSMWFIRDNRIDIDAGQGIWVDTYSLNGLSTHDIEISYNLVIVRSGYALWIGQEPVTYGPMTLFRNTFVGAQVAVDNLTSDSGPVSFDADVILNDSTSSTKITTTGAVGTTNLLSGSSSSGIVDSAGNLSSAYQQYLGTRGYQRIGGAANASPSTPGAFVVR